MLVSLIDRRITLKLVQGKTVILEPWDLTVLSQGGARISRLEAASAVAPTAVFLASLPIGITGRWKPWLD